MKLFKPALLALGVAITFFAGIETQKSGLLNMSKTDYLRTTEPLLINAEGQAQYFHLLPVGTALYKDESFAEGHTRYRVYINIKGAFAADAVTADKANLIDPIWAYTIKKDELRPLLATSPVSKNELVAILKARKLTRADIEQLLREWVD